MPISTKVADPTATSTLVRSPPERCRYWRSAPISVPSTNAPSRLISESKNSGHEKALSALMEAPPSWHQCSPVELAYPRACVLVKSLAASSRGVYARLEARWSDL